MYTRTNPTTFTTLDLARLTVLDVMLDPQNINRAEAIRVKHPSMPGTRWMSLNNKNTGYISRHSGGAYAAECFCVHGCYHDVIWNAVKAKR